MSTDELYKRALALAEEAHKAALDPANPLLLHDLARVIKEIVRHPSAIVADEIEDTLAVWDDLSLAIDRVVTALPAQMTEASQDLEVRRAEMHKQMNNLGRAKP